MIQEELKNKDKDLKGMKKALGEMLDRSWEKGYIAGFNDGYATRREADKMGLKDLCETCAKSDECAESTKIFSKYRTSKCYKYEEATDDDKAKGDNHIDLLDEFIDDLEQTAKQLDLLKSAERDPLLILSYQRSAMSALRLAEYLKELRHLRNITEYIKDTPCASACFKGENMNIIQWAEKQLEAKP